ncbi:uncharacterized protein CTHT_0050060 [Thermochaetoides thermophila DSM 1495]|uniref:Peptide hydrolase n=1 Tax=Chaetomium thermophilum (strain DSM 1495 / CBS 144.50 / IMI 039719) TaxID=759272 RepID=G0SBF2_CHATD|nr:hypothetical protein CTHT_0050060 [Thermochaetoides thermophila DSM 1495]EGS19532.1 hypothetical protein CTHT_0050060 [Thermochaetoides thermophila DSM 1495]
MKTSLASILLLAVQMAWATRILTPDAIEADIQERELQNVIWHLNHIAEKNGGNRAFGEPGYAASMDFILERARIRFADKFDTFVQPFNHTYDKTNAIKVTGPDGEDVYVVSPQYNPATPLPGGITAGLVDTPVDDARGSMCLEDHWAGVEVKGKLALVKRGVCAVADKLRWAKKKGALGVILYNQDPGTGYSVPTLSADSIGETVPVGIIPLDVAQSWQARLAAGEEVVVNLLVDSIIEERESWNIIVETKKGDPNKVVMLGAHLDGVQAGPGINDNGSGSAGLLEILTAVAHYDVFKHKIRFAWWGAEENGLVGSLYYTSKLSEEEVNRIKYYFNYDMIGSPDPVYGIGVDENSGIGGDLLVDYLVSKGKSAYKGGMGGGSDHVGFVNLGIPTIFGHTGLDTCYHQHCDNINNIDFEALTLMTKAAARAMAQFANSLEGVPERKLFTRNPNSRSQIVKNFRRWADVEKEVSKEKLCGHTHEKITV